jgi:CubicO group peptidase (beta-lactamase class C family)
MKPSLSFLAAAAVAACLILPPVVAAEPISAAKIDETVARAMKTFNVPGIAVAVVKDDKVVYSKGMGLAALDTGGKVDEHTLFGIASNSKAFVAASLAILVDEKKLKWSDKVTDIIPEFRMYDPYVTAEFTIEDLLTHRSGLGLGAGDLMEFPDGGNFTRADVIHNLRFLKPVSGFRTKFDYDNQLYIVAGEVVARVSGMPWEDFVEQRIMRPLGMNESAASRKRAPKSALIAMPHVEIDGGEVRQVDAEMGEIGNAAGGIVSNIADLTKWVRVQLNGGVYDDAKHLFSAGSQATMWSPHTILPGSPKPTYETLFNAYGLGWFLYDANGYKVVTHTGGLIGMVTQVVLVPKLKLGIVVLTNQQQGAAFQSISTTVLDSYLGVRPSDRVAELRARVDQRVAAAAKESDAARKAMMAPPTGPSPDPAAFAGTYRDPWFGEVTLTNTGGKLYFAAKRSPKLSGEMRYYQGNSYIVQWKDRSYDADAYVNFVLGVDGKPSRMTMAPVSPLTYFSFDFQDLDFQPVK